MRDIKSKSDFVLTRDNIPLLKRIDLIERQQSMLSTHLRKLRERRLVGEDNTTSDPEGQK